MSLAAALVPAGAVSSHEVTWLVLLPAGQAGPYTAAQMAALLDDGGLNWSSLVWRQGLKGWRSARRDPQLVTSAAAARGMSSWGDTLRVGSSRRSPLPAADTVVEPAPPQLTSLFDRSRRPANFDWAEDSGAAPTQLASRPAESTLADAFRSAPGIVGSPASQLPTDTVPVRPRQSSPSSWLPSPQSMLVVAVVAFASGVLVAALWGRLAPRIQPRSPTVIVRSSVTHTPPVVSHAEPQLVEVAPQMPVAVTSIAAPPSHDVPVESELLREVRRVSPDVRRCVDDLARGADLEIYFDGPTGHVRDIKLRAQRLTPGRAECITQAVRQMQVSPFRKDQYKYWHKFSY